MIDRKKESKHLKDKKHASLFLKYFKYHRR